MDKWIQDGEVDPGERLQKYLARSGVASRRHAEELITAGSVTVNGHTVTEQGVRIVPGDVVMVNGQRVVPVATTTTVALHKPVGYVSTARDPQGRAITSDLLPADLRSVRLVPVGRLDVDSEGLLLLSNDGDLALKLTHPRYGAEKEYHALVVGNVSDAALERLRTGVVLAGEDTRPTAPANVWRLPEAAPLGHSWIAVAIHEGRKRQVRLMFAAVGNQVTRLIRTRIGHLTLQTTVPEVGHCRPLSPAQIARALGK